MLRKNEARCRIPPILAQTGLSHRMDRSRSCDLGGIGFGLSIVKYLMIAHGGKIEI
jgi:signal transduction histidine kinase